MLKLFCSGLIFISAQTTPSAAEEVSDPLSPFVGNWSCVYISAYDPAKYLPRAKTWTIMPTGESITTGYYPLGHSTGIQGAYRSKSKLLISDDFYTQVLRDYELIDPLLNGVPMSDQDVTDFELQVMSGNPVSANYEWNSADSFHAISKYTDMLCERVKEANS